jgi:hypothetical protein
MARKKAHEIYGSFQDWIDSHEKYSSNSIALALENSTADPENTQIESLSTYISRLEDLRSEIDSEIQETREWIECLRAKELIA